MAYRWLVVALATMSVTACGTATRAAEAPSVAVTKAARPTAPATRAPAAKPPPPRITYPGHGHGHWTAAPAQGGGLPDGPGKLLRYRVVVESDIQGLTPAAFGQAVATTLADPQGWTAGGRWRFHRVAGNQSHDFTIFLATPDTRDQLCAEGTDGYTSCRHGDGVILNVARWVKGVPEYGSDLAGYRKYMVNHEVGHRLGRGHELCPGPGDPAPVMEQQTLGLHGCRPNPWPYPGGDNYTGPSGAYSNKQPPRDRGNR